jgi:hypothetical protein
VLVFDIESSAACAAYTSSADGDPGFAGAIRSGAGCDPDIAAAANIEVVNTLINASFNRRQHCRYLSSRRRL